MSESPKRPAPPKDAAPAGEAAQKNAIHKLRSTLETALADGNLDRARAHLRMTSPVTARAAVMALGAPYVKALQTAPHVTLDGKQGADAAKQFIDEELRPLVTREAHKDATREARKGVTPRKDFNAQKNKSAPAKPSLMKRLWRGTAMGTLLLAVSTSMVIETTAPARSNAEGVQAAIVTESIRTDVSQLRAEFGKTSLGRDMLAMADANGVSIVYDDALSGTNTLGSYNAGGKSLRMNPSQTLAEQVMIMAHELRHAWQDAVLGYGEMENRLLTPQQQWTLRRYLEADAFAFSAYFMAERMLELPEAEKPNGLREMAAAHLLHGEFASEDGLTHEEYRRFALDRMFETLGGSYNETHLRLANGQNKPFEDDTKFAQQMMQRGDLDGALATMRELQARMRTTPSAQDFDTYLRRFGGMSLDPAEQTALQSPTPASPAGRAAAPTAAQTPAPQDPDAPPSTSSDSAVNAQLATSEALNQTFRALAREMTRYVELEREMAIRAGKPTTNSRFIPVAPAGGDSRAQDDAPAQNRHQPKAP